MQIAAGPSHENDHEVAAVCVFGTFPK